VPAERLVFLRLRQLRLAAPTFGKEKGAKPFGPCIPRPTVHEVGQPKSLLCYDYPSFFFQLSHCCGR
jgi:hypothetical protein